MKRARLHRECALDCTAHGIFRALGQKTRGYIVFESTEKMVADVVDVPLTYV